MTRHTGPMLLAFPLGATGCILPRAPGLMLHIGDEERRLVLKGVIDCRNGPAGIVFAHGELAPAR